MYVPLRKILGCTIPLVLPLILAVLLSCSSSGGVKTIELPVPDAGEVVNVYSLVQPYELSLENYGKYEQSDMARIGRFYVIDRKDFVGEDLVTQLLEHLSSSVTNNPERVVMCFNPRYALFYKSEGNPVDVLVSFECKKISLKINGQKKFLYVDDNEEKLKVDEMFKSLGLKIPFTPWRE